MIVMRFIKHYSPPFVTLPAQEKTFPIWLLTSGA